MNFRILFEKRMFSRSVSLCSNAVHLLGKTCSAQQFTQKTDFFFFHVELGQLLLARSKGSKIQEKLMQQDKDKLTGGGDRPFLVRNSRVCGVGMWRTFVVCSVSSSANPWQIESPRAPQKNQPISKKNQLVSPIMLRPLYSFRRVLGGCVLGLLSLTVLSVASSTPPASPPTAAPRARLGRPSPCYVRHITFHNLSGKPVTIESTHRDGSGGDIIQRHPVGRVEHLRTIFFLLEDLVLDDVVVVEC